MKRKLMTMLDKYLDALPMTGAAVGLVVLACVFSGTLREILQRANLDMLAAGGTKTHRELLAPFGLNAADPAFWHKGLSIIGGFIDELERLG